MEPVTNETAIRWWFTHITKVGGVSLLFAVVFLAMYIGIVPNPVLKAIEVHALDTQEGLRLNYLNCEALQTLAKRDPTRCYKEVLKLPRPILSIPQ